MKFVCSININKPISEVAKHFEDPEALKQSQKDFVSLEHLYSSFKDSSLESLFLIFI